MGIEILFEKNGKSPDWHEEDHANPGLMICWANAGAMADIYKCFPAPWREEESPANSVMSRESGSLFLFYLGVWDGGGVIVMATKRVAHKSMTAEAVGDVQVLQYVIVLVFIAPAADRVAHKSVALQLAIVN